MLARLVGKSRINYGLNTQWWNHPYAKPVPADRACGFADPDIALDEIITVIEENQGRERHHCRPLPA